MATKRNALNKTEDPTMAQAINDGGITIQMILAEIEERTGVDVNPKSFRAFMRRQTDDRAGKGGRYALDRATADALIERWINGRSKGVNVVLKND